MHSNSQATGAYLYVEPCFVHVQKIVSSEGTNSKSLELLRPTKEATGASETFSVIVYSLCTLC